MNFKLLQIIIALYLFNLQFAQAFTLKPLYPINNAYVGNSFSLGWNAAVQGVNYRVQISTGSNMSTLLLDTIINTNSITYNIPNSGQYFWRYKYYSTSYSSGWSEVANFSILDPKTKQGMLLWLAADSAVVSSNDTVSQWTDLSGNNNHATQLIASKRPNKLSTVLRLNNKPAIRFNNPGFEDHHLKLQSYITTCQDVFIIFNHQTGTQSYAALLGGSTTDHYTGNVGDDLMGFASPPIRNGRKIRNTIEVASVNELKKPLQYTLLTLLQNGYSSFDHLSSDRYNLGRFWNGDIAELLVYSSNFSDEDRIQVESYLLNKYAPPVNLGYEIVAGSSFCSNVTLSAEDRFLNYLWSTGSTTNTTSVQANGTYFLNVKDIFGMESQAQVSVYPYKRLNNARLYICSGDTMDLNLNTPPGFTATWNNGLTGTQIRISDAGQYIVRITDGNGCFVNDTVNVIKEEPKLSLTIDALNNITACTGEKLYILTETAFDTILWSTGVNSTNFITLQNPGTYSVYARTTSGCILNQSFNVTIAGKAPTANFTSASLCQNAPVNFTDLSIPPVGDVITDWKWNFSNTNTSTQQNPTTTFSNIGSVNAALKITTNRGCSDSIFKTFTVYKRPSAGFYNLLACSGNPTTFIDTSRAGSGTISTHFWDFAGLGTSNNTTPVFYFPDVATYNVFHQVTNSFGCTDTITRPVYINPSPIAHFAFDSVCYGGSSYTSFKYLPSIQSPFTIDRFSWDFGDGEQNNSIKNVTHQYNEAGIYTVQLYVQASNQCVDTVQKQVQVFEPVNVDFVTSASQCVNKPIQFTDISSSQGLPVSNWNWYFAGQGTSSIQHPQHTFISQGNYVVQLTASNSIGCTGTKQRSVAVSDVPKPNFTFTPNYGPAPLIVNYTNLSALNGSYIWSYGDGTAPITGFNAPAHTYTVNGSYPITLISTNYRGCTDSLTKYILVDQAYIDGVMVAVRLVPNGDFYKVEVTIQNNSNIELTQMGLSLQLGNGSVIRENWTGSILPGETRVYTFVGEIKLGENMALPLVCATIENVNNLAPENRTDNNTSCKEITSGEFDVLSIYPNPAQESISFGIMLPKDGKVSILIIDALGQLEYKKEFNGVKGYNRLNVSTLPLNAATYIAEIIFDGNILYRKFQKTDK